MRCSLLGLVLVRHILWSHWLFFSCLSCYHSLLSLPALPTRSCAPELWAFLLWQHPLTWAFIYIYIYISACTFLLPDYVHTQLTPSFFFFFKNNCTHIFPFFFHYCHSVVFYQRLRFKSYFLFLGFWVTIFSKQQLSLSQEHPTDLWFLKVTRESWGSGLQ